MGAGTGQARNTEWFHMLNSDVISMPDKWEYPWYAAWDLAFHTIALSLVDFDFAKEQLLLMLRNLYCPSQRADSGVRMELQRRESAGTCLGHTLFLYSIEKELGRADLRFLERSFQGLMLNFNWWVNRKDPSGPQRVRRRVPRARQHRGLRSQRAAADRWDTWTRPTARHGWRSTARCMLEIALILTEYDPMYEEIAFRFLEHFIWIAYAMDRIGDNHDEMWDDGGRLLLRPAPLPQWRCHALEGPLDGGTCCRYARRQCSKGLRFWQRVTRECRNWSNLFRKRHPEVIRKNRLGRGHNFVGYTRRRLTDCQFATNRS